ncbi:30S ribosomal protein S17 [bacterium]|nr:30S ribosomal protein S17 [candidate division CSSED10-310 bacterium]
MSAIETNGKHRKRRIGVVVSDRMFKTVNVMVERTVIHPRFRKEVKKRKKFMAHDAENRCKIGDRVLIEEVRPLSKLKRWQVIEVLEQSK